MDGQDLASVPPGLTMRRTPIALLLLVALGAPASARAADGDIIVRRDPGLDRAERAELRERAGVRLAETLPLPRTEVVTPQGSVRDSLDALRSDPDVVYAEPDLPVHATEFNDPGYPSLWGLDNTGQSVSSFYDHLNYRAQGGLPDADIDAPEAWQRSLGAGVTVGVVDTGVDATQPDLAGRLDTSLGHDWVGDDNDPTDANGHGTHVTGTIAALAGNGTGIAGVAPEAEVAALRVLDANGDGVMSDVAAAFSYAGSHGLRVVNASLGGGKSTTVALAIAQFPQTLFIVAAGNHGVSDDNPATADYPCALPYANVICVGASDNRDQPAIFSNFGTLSVDLFAPGVGIWSTYLGPGESYAQLDGTSMATPHVSGAAALALAANPSATAAQLRAALLTGIDHPAALASVSATGGRLNADAAVQAIAAATPVPTATPTPTPAPPAATPTPTPVPTPVPAEAKLTSIRISGSLRTKKSKLTVRYTLTRAAAVRFTVTRRGSKTSLGTWTRSGRAGANVVSLTRRLPTGRTLKPGTYTLALSLAHSARSARFRVQ
jgi:thermitase